MKNTSKAVNKIIFVSDTSEHNISVRLPRLVSSWTQAGLEEIVSLQISPSDTWRKTLSAQNIKSTIRLVDKIDSTRVFSLARQENASMVVFDTVKQGDDRRALFRTLTNRTPLPLLLIHGDGNQSSSADGPGVFDTVVIAQDFSPAYNTALEFLFNFKELIQSLEIVNVINSKLTIRDIHLLKQELHVTRRLCTEKGINAEYHVYAGKTPEELNASVRDYRATLIVLGIHEKLRWFKRLFHQSAIYTLIQQAPVPILLVP